MKISSIKTDKVRSGSHTLEGILDAYVSNLPERSILAITSKVLAICEGAVVKVGSIEKQTLIEQEAEWFLPQEENEYGIPLTIKRGILIPSAGIDESNGDGYYILWPRDPYRTANEVRKYLARRFGVKDVGVLITDSKSTPMRWGTTGVALAHSGFDALNNYIGEEDIFGKEMHFTKSSIADALSAAAVLLMGEGKEQTPMARIEELTFVHFTGGDTSDEDIRSLQISREKDLYASVLNRAPWKKGGAND